MVKISMRTTTQKITSWSMTDDDIIDIIKAHFKLTATPGVAVDFDINSGGLLKGAMVTLTEVSSK